MRLSGRRQKSINGPDTGGTTVEGWLTTLLGMAQGGHGWHGTGTGRRKERLSVEGQQRCRTGTTGLRRCRVARQRGGGMAWMEMELLGWRGGGQRSAGHLNHGSWPMMESPFVGDDGRGGEDGAWGIDQSDLKREDTGVWADRRMGGFCHERSEAGDGGGYAWMEGDQEWKMRAMRGFPFAGGPTMGGDGDGVLAGVMGGGQRSWRAVEVVGSWMGFVGVEGGGKGKGFGHGFSWLEKK